MPALDNLPERVEKLETAVAEFRAEVRAEFAQLRSEMHSEFGAVRVERKAGDEETRRMMRMLHEDVVERIKTLGEALDTRRKPRRR